MQFLQFCNSQTLPIFYRSSTKFTFTQISSPKTEQLNNLISDEKVHGNESH